MPFLEETAFSTITVGNPSNFQLTLNHHGNQKDTAYHGHVRVLLHH